MKWLAKILKDQKGQGLVEYGLILALIAAVCIAIISQLGGQIQAAFQCVLNELMAAA